MGNQMSDKYNPFRDQEYYKLWGINTEEKLYFYYDESNNCRKFWLNAEKDDFNADPDADFVLAGVASENIPNICFGDLRRRFKLQNGVNELKSKIFFKGKTFIECMGTEGTTALLDLINELDMYIHYVHINNFFYTIVEILDSITNPREIYEYGFDYFLLKTTLFNMLHPKINEVAEIMIRYAYPNIKKRDVTKFCMDICDLLGPKYEMKPDEKYVYGCLQRAAKGEKLVFVQDNPEFLLQEDYSIFYANRIVQFPLSQHCFDEELSIQASIAKQVGIFSGDEKLSNYTFVNSKNNLMIQVSDLVAGLLGRMFVFFNTNEVKDFRIIIEKLSERQLVNLLGLQKLRYKSDLRNKGLLHSITAIGILSKIDVFYDDVKVEMNKRKAAL